MLRERHPSALAQEPGREVLRQGGAAALGFRASSHAAAARFSQGDRVQNSFVVQCACLSQPAARVRLSPSLHPGSAALAAGAVLTFADIVPPAQSALWSLRREAESPISA